MSAQTISAAPAPFRTTALPVNNRIPVTMPAGEITAHGQSLIHTYLARFGLSLPPDWQWAWKILGKAEYVGTFSKRVARFAYRTAGIKLAPDVITQIGNLAAVHCDREGSTYWIDFDRELDWQSGDFGDEGSCFFDGRAHVSARYGLRDHGAYAIRTWHELPGSGWQGHGRAWIVDEGTFFVVFNGYGLETLNFARILAQYTGLCYIKVELDNSDAYADNMYVNGDSGYLVGPIDVIGEYSRYSMEIECGCDVCCNCGSAVDEDATMTSDISGDVYCEECYGELFSFCEQCETDVPRDDIYEVRQTTATDGLGEQCETDGLGEQCTETRYVCDSCRNFGYTECAHCGEYWATADCVETGTGEFYCPECDDKLTCCEECVDYYADNAVLIGPAPDGFPYCGECWGRLFLICPHCGEPRPKDVDEACPNCAAPPVAESQLVAN